MIIKEKGHTLKIIGETGKIYQGSKERIIEE